MGVEQVWHCQHEMLHQHARSSLSTSRQADDQMNTAASLDAIVRNAATILQRHSLEDQAQLVGRSALVALAALDLGFDLENRMKGSHTEVEGSAGERRDTKQATFDTGPFRLPLEHCLVH